MNQRLLNRLTLWAVFWLTSTLAYSQSMSLNILPRVVCLGNPMQVEAFLTGVNVNDVDSFRFEWGDGTVNLNTTGSPVTNTRIYQYTTAGIYKIKVVAIFRNRAPIEATEWDTVYNRPIAAFTMTSLDSQCFKYNYYCFKDLTQQAAAPSLPLNKLILSYGDGDSDLVSMGGTVCHKFLQGNRRFNVTLSTTDVGGCETKAYNYVFVAPNLDPKFSLSGTPRCDTTPYIFVNNTPISPSNLQWFRWEYGDDSVWTSSSPIKAQEVNSSLPVTDSTNRWQSFTYKYTKNGVFNPRLIIKHKNYNCTDTFYYSMSGNQLPENIVLRFDVRSRRTNNNDTIADSVCLMNLNMAGVCLYNNYPLQGVNSQIQILWDFADPNASPPGSDKKLNEVTPCYKYQSFGHYFPTLYVSCPGQPLKTVRFWSRIDTAQLSDTQYVPPPVVNPGINTINGYFFRTNDCISQYRWIYDKRGPTQTSTFTDYTNDVINLNLHGMKNGDKIIFTNLGDIKGLTYCEEFYVINATTNNFQLSRTPGGPLVDLVSTGTGGSVRWEKVIPGNPSVPRDSIVSYWKWFNDDVAKKNFKVRKTQLQGYGLNIMGPLVQVEDPNVPVTMKKYLKNQCGPDLPVEFTNATNGYQSNNLYIKWDFADDYAPQCTSYSLPNPSTPNGGREPYVSANDMFNRTLGRFSFGGRMYPGRLNCKFSHDTLPIHQYQRWADIFRWFKYGHDFPPFDSSATGWAKTPTPGKKLVHPLDSATWGKPMYSSGTTPSRVDTLARMWPADINPNRPVRITRPIPDPFANAAGYWQYTIPAGTQIDSSGFTNPRLSDKLPNGVNRANYRGNMKLPGSNMTLYEYFFYRSVAACYTVKLYEKDSFNSQSGDPFLSQSRINMVGGNIIIQQTHDTTPGNPIVLQSDTFNYTSTPASIFPVMKDYTIINGTNYITATNLVPTGGSGTGMKIDIYADSGFVKGIQILQPGRGYIVGDILTIPGGDGNAKITITSLKDVLVYNFKFYDVLTDPSTSQKYILKKDDEFFVDKFDCGDEATVQLPLVGVDAYGMGKRGKECPGLFDGKKGGNPQFVFSNAANNPGTYPDCNQRTFILLNYDSLLDRKDNTPCDLDGFVDWQGQSPLNPSNPTVTPGGNTFPGFFNMPNFPPIPGGPWTGPAGPINYTHYQPSGANWAYTASPKDKKGYVTVGLILGAGCIDFACSGPACLTDTVWYHNFFHFITLDAFFTHRKVGGYLAYGVPSRLPSQDYTYDTAQFFKLNNPAPPPAVLYAQNGAYKLPWSRLYGKGDIVEFEPYTKQQDFVLTQEWDWADGTMTIDSFYTNEEDTFVKLDPINQPNDSSFFAANTYPLGRVRYNFDVSSYPWTVLNVSVPYPVGQRVYKGIRYDTIWQCWDYTHAYPPTQINRTDYLVDTAFFLWPVTHQYTKSSAEMYLRGGTFKVNDITQVTLTLKTVTECENYESRWLVIGVMDTFQMKEGDQYTDGLVCVGQTVTFADSIRYWFPFSNGAYIPSRPIPIPKPHDELLWEIDMHGVGMINYPLDSIKTSVNPTKFYSTLASGCPNGWQFVQQGTAPNLFNFCYKIDTNFYERIYWDFESDGIIDATGKNPKHKFDKPGVYTISMISRDTVGYFDTCQAQMKVVEPVAHFYSKGIFSCSDPTIFHDSSYILGNVYIPGVPQDDVKEIRWWFGDYGYGPNDYRSTLKDPFYPYRKNGWYRVMEVLETNQGCFDTTINDIYISGPRPRIKLLADTLGCVPYTVKVVSYPNDSLLSATASTLIRSGRPDGGYNTITVNNPDTVTIVYDKEGVYYLTAVGYDKNPPVLATCPPIVVPDTINGAEKPIKIYVKNPYKVALESDKDKVCVGEPFLVKNRSDMDTITKFRMYAYNENFTSISDTAYKTNYGPDSSFKYVFFNAGKYNLVMHSTRFINQAPPCDSKDTIQVTALLAKADLKIDSLGMPKYYIWNKSDSTQASSYIWRVYNPDGSTRIQIFVPSDNDPNYHLGELDLKNDTGEFTVCIWAITEGLENCVDSVCQKVYNTFQIDIDIPNVFTPNGDGKNDVFNIKIKGEEVYDLKIWNRWGGLVFESTDSKVMWNGKTKNTGEENPEGTYYYVFRYKLRGQSEQTVRGTITLIRD